MKKILEIQQNDQIDNKLLGRIKPSGQCGYTAAAMLLSSVYDKAKTDEFIVELIIFMMELKVVHLGLATDKIRSKLFSGIKFSRI